MKVGFFRALRFVSFFNYGYEALVVNELAGRTIKDFQVRGKGGSTEYMYVCVCGLATGRWGAWVAIAANEWVVNVPLSHIM